jgi:hypothetical protein
VRATLRRRPRTIVLDRTARRPPLLLLLVAVLVVLGVAAIGGGLTMAASPTGGLIGMDTSWLDRVPLLDTWLVPGLILAGGIGLGALVAAYGLLRRPAWPRWAAVRRLEALTGRHWSWATTIGMGGVLIGWLLVQLVFISERIWLQGACLAVGALLMAGPMTRRVQEDLSR